MLSFGVQIICIRHILFELCIREKKTEKRKKKIEILHAIFLPVRRINGTLRVCFNLEELGVFIYKRFA